ncbi:mechanosensitive ion channel [Antarcticibacterium sp. 1MA-6-2]|uniref:mechanosensitive ion channel family protein n=1 Tax=Antarcticibacterium sp. 1MA-6-2 TaxID=2908210 RepID=UPI001F2ECBF0|nr:mechanosensitive ion channel domain-containing protein [Antarcticibacterium sp. 1MA-6-2]UJH90879.1 mechanosensitive ion channel [Antarcticibacterium sp. 1MA-6-2]
MEYFQDIEYYVKEFTSQLIDYLPNFLAAIFLLVFGIWFIKILTGYIRKLIHKKGYDKTIENFVISLVGVGLKILLVILVITQLGFETTSLVAVIGAASLAIGLALQGSLSNFAGGVLILILKPFRVGDWIEAKGVSGSVKETSLFYTKLVTFGNQLAIIPNGQLTNDNIINYTVEGKRRDAITIGISYESNIKLAKEILLNLMMEQEGILKDPEPVVMVTDLADSSVNLSLRFFALNDNFWNCHWYTIEEAKMRLEAAGISIPFPQRDVHFFDHSEGSKNGKKSKNEIQDQRN